MDRFRLGPRDIYSRSFLLPAGKNGKKPKKIIGTPGKPVSGNLEAALQKIFSILAVLPSVQLGLVDAANLTLSGDDTAVVSHSAHDNIPTYELLEHWDINALIDINGRAKSSENAPDDITFSKEGHPVCKAGHEMWPHCYFSLFFQ